MAKDQTVAPQERVNITYKPATGDRQSEVELPLKMLFIGDYTGRTDERQVEDRKPINVDKDNFNQVLGEQNVTLSVNVPNRLTDEPGAELSAKLSFKKLSDFGPDAVAEQIPEVKTLLEVRAALTALKGPLGNVPAFRKKLQALLSDTGSRERLMRELGIEDKEEGK
jgi:type VI secretion system protein ImpB